MGNGGFECTNTGHQTGVGNGDFGVSLLAPGTRKLESRRVRSGGEWTQRETSRLAAL